MFDYEHLYWMITSNSMTQNQSNSLNIGRVIKLLIVCCECMDKWFPPPLLPVIVWSVSSCQLLVISNLKTWYSTVVFQFSNDTCTISIVLHLHCLLVLLKHKLNRVKFETKPQFLWMSSKHMAKTYMAIHKCKRLRNCTSIGLHL